jgi:hypothetical protein
MTVYVDFSRIPYARMIMSHMLADTLEELHAMADTIGLARKHFQPLSTPHYDVSQAYRQKAVRAGAVEINRRKTVQIIRKWREKQLQET